MGIKLFYLNFWILKKITFWNTINGRRIQKGASYGMGLSKSFFCGCQPKKKCASYGMGFSKLFFVGVNQKRNKVPVMACPFQNLIFLGGAHPKNRCQLWHWNFKALLLFGGLPKKWCQLWHGTCLIFIWGASQKKLLFLAWNLPQKMCQLWHAFAPYLFSFGGYPKKKCASYGMETYSLIFI